MKKTAVTYSVTELMWKTLSSCVDDFRSSLPPSFCRLMEHLIALRDIEGLRGLEICYEDMADSHAFKCVYQTVSLCKRTILLGDSMTTADLESKAISAFIENQSRLAQLNIAIPKHYGPAMSYARGICHDILGEWSTSEFLSLCRHGSHAAVGVPLRRAKLDAKWETLSGSSAHISWFGHDYLWYHDHAREFFAANNMVPIQPVCNLRMTFVPKSYKAVRSITPNTVLGALHSDGLGKMIANRLKRHGLDISSLQEEHRALAKEASITGELVTCDQSSASDNITRQLLDLLLPQRWLDELSLGRIDTVTLPDGTSTHLESFCTMGIGFTFALQTLVFYAIARGIEYQFASSRLKNRLLEAKRGTSVSCYGDDLIFARELWPFFRALAPKLGLVVNQDKTYADGYFRESCGGDYHRGVDVRPFQPKWCDTDSISRQAYEQLLYKFINGFRRRWADEELSSTLLLLCSELSLLTERPCFVPSNFAEDSGIVVSSLSDLLVTLFETPFLRNRNGACIFTYLSPSGKDAKVSNQLYFLWESLQDRPEELRDRFKMTYVDSVPYVRIPGTYGYKRKRAVTVLL